ncbi:phosphoesterase [Novosphingobium guangzhouense]|uniref:Phosphoesterase n=1 Tax=Novosphingobium guangzhouense TaxID=1850347 RepID=A0A2K2FSJ4_9SPHN|nr:phosphoesterase [Novosphingobium guangzhouense]PNU01751.1 phosphoesterase [Novosphingobium guangzhouense]
MAIHFVADLNFNGDSALHAIPYGFPDNTEMARRICEVWRARVAADDIVWILGNVGNPVHLGGLPGVKHLVRASGDPLPWNCLATGRYASVCDVRRLDTAHGTITLINDPTKAPEGDTRVLHGHTRHPWQRKGHTCVAIHEIGWGPVSLDMLMLGAGEARLSRAA